MKISTVKFNNCEVCMPVPDHVGSGKNLDAEVSWVTIPTQSRVLVTQGVSMPNKTKINGKVLTGVGNVGLGFNFG